jgi:hypothetical protein
MVARRASRDRSVLDLLLTIDDLPPGWRQKRQERYRVGLLYDEDWDKRARREKLVGAMRSFVNPETRSRIVVQAAPVVTDEDARSVVTEGRWNRSPDLKAHTTDEAEVSAPPEAGEYATASLVSTTGQAGASRKLSVMWPEPGPLVLAIVYTAPADVAVYDVMSGLIQRQRQRLATKPEV